VEIYNIDVLSWVSPYLKVLVHCSKGTYIRSLARDLGVAAGSCASLAALKRISVGPYRLNEAVEADSFTEGENLVEPWDVFEQLTSAKRLIVDSELIPLIRDGKESVFGKLKDQLPQEGEYALFTCEKQFLAMINSHEGRISYRFVC